MVYLIVEAERRNETPYNNNNNGGVKGSKSRNQPPKRAASVESLILKVRPSDASKLIIVRATGLLKEELESNFNFWSDFETHNFFFTFNGMQNSKKNSENSYAKFSILPVPRTGL